MPMIYAFCGPPSSHAIFVSRLGFDILRHAVGAFHYVPANTAEELAEGVADRGGLPCVFYFEIPDVQMAHAIVKYSVPLVFTAEPFENIVAYCMAAREMSVEQAVRLTTQSFASLFRIATSPNIAPISLTAHLDLRTLINNISLSLDIELSEAHVTNLLALYGQLGRSDSVLDIIHEKVENAAAAADLLHSLDPDQRALIKDIAAGYESLLGDKRDSATVRWPSRFSFSGEPPNNAINGPMPMLGRARALSFGPYLHLPKGNWQARITFGVLDNISGNELMVDVVISGEVVCFGTAKMPQVGNFSVALYFTVEEPNIPLEIRTFMMKGAIEGMFELHDIALSLVAEE